RAVEGYGGKIVFCEPTERARADTCSRIISETGATLIHPFENENVMAGQGTVMVELFEEVADLDMVLCPVGGGGLLSGVAVAAKTLRPSIKVIATEPATAGDAAESFREKKLVHLENKNTIADGLRTNLGAPNFAFVRDYVDDVVTVSE